MKKFILGATALALSITITACGPSANDATIKNLANQLDETSNALSDFKTINPSEISMTKDTLNTLAQTDNSIYDNLINTQQSLLTEEYYKTDILNQTAKIKNCLSKDIKLSKAQISAVKDLTNNLSKYTNSIEYTKSELSSAVKAVSTMKKNANKNSDKIGAKLSRIICNSNARSAYYENILNTLNQIECYICCEDKNCCENEDTNNLTTEAEQNKTSSEEHKKTNTDDFSENTTSTANKTKTNSKTLPINIDTYAPTNRNTDLINYSQAYPRNRYSNFNRVYPYGYGFNTNFYGFNQPTYPYAPMNYPYGNTFNSNNINRAYYNNAIPVSEIQNNEKITPTTKESLSTPRLEDFEEIKDGELKKITENNTTQQNKHTMNETNEITTTATKPVRKIIETIDNRTPQEIKKDLDQPITAH